MSIFATTAVSFVMLGAITGAQLSNNTGTYHPQSGSHRTLTTVAAKAPVPKPKPATVPAAAPTPPPAPQPVIVAAQPGDTLTTIAEAHDTTYTQVFNANADIANPDIITVGQQIRIPDPGEQLPDRSLPTAPVATVTAPTTRQASVVTASVPIVGNDAKAFIYSHESGNNPNATSPSGCYGLGQDCNGVLRDRCGADYACQDAYFTDYATRRYGSWEGAAAFWQANGWW